LTIYTTDVLQYRSRLKGLGEAYRKVMGRHYPAMALLEVKGLFEPNARIELEATAIL
jgi:enamine deaminase RidA (YjgF/YER057c/UK114 family)